MVNNIFLGLGSNRGDRFSYLKSAVQKIKENFILEEYSSVYETEPFGYKEQEHFYNAVVKINTSLPLKELCPLIKKLEIETGRIPGQRWGPREIDIDLLFYNDMVYSDEKLTIPHKEFLLRDFVIVPMQEIAPDFIHPVNGIKMKDIDLTGIENLIVKKYSRNHLNLYGE